MVTLYFSFCGSLWFIWAVNNYTKARPCVNGLNINFYIILCYGFTLFIQTGCAILLLAPLMYIESKWRGRATCNDSVIVSRQIQIYNQTKLVNFQIK